MPEPARLFPLREGGRAFGWKGVRKPCNWEVFITLSCVCSSVLWTHRVLVLVWKRKKRASELRGRGRENCTRGGLRKYVMEMGIVIWVLAPPHSLLVSRSTSLALLHSDLRLS